MDERRYLIRTWSRLPRIDHIHRSKLCCMVVRMTFKGRNIWNARYILILTSPWPKPPSSVIRGGVRGHRDITSDYVRDMSQYRRRFHWHTSYCGHTMAQLRHSLRLRTLKGIYMSTCDPFLPLAIHQQLKSESKSNLYNHQRTNLLIPKCLRTALSPNGQAIRFRIFQDISA